MSEKNEDLVPFDGLDDLLNGEREGYFKSGHDKLGRPYEKKLDANNIYTKKEILKDGTPKLTIKYLGDQFKK